ncbi:hypothetical protein ASG58_11290 [Rhizobium sp. Leaf383]|nr:hypothetical protein ASG58_11290 [Rhizobium sp. Leaf383]
MVDLFCVFLRSDEDLLELLYDGVLKALRPGAIIVNHATGDPAEARMLEKICSARGIRFVDAPVSGGRPGAVSRTLTCFVGTTSATLDECRDLLSSHSAHVVHMGAAGTGQAARLCNNALTVSNLRNVVEVFSVADTFGVAPAKLQSAFSHSNCGSFISDALGTKVTPTIAAHIAELNRCDVEEFTAAAGKLRLDVSALRAWAIGGAAGLEEAVLRLVGDGP